MDESQSVPDFHSFNVKTFRMKSLLVVVCLLLVGVMVRADFRTETTAYVTLVKPQIEECSKKLDVPLEGLEEKLIDMKLEGAERKKMGCFHACLMNADGGMEGAVIKTEQMRTKVLAVIPDPTMIETRMKILNECAETVKDKTDECEVGYDFTACVIERSS